MIARRSLVRFGAFAALVALVGCSGKSRDDLAQVSGVVTMDGAPLDGGKVTFHSTVETGGAKGVYSTYTDSNGKYVIATVGKDPGLPPGMYKVTVTKADPKLKGGAAMEGMDAGQLEAMGATKNSLGGDYERFDTTKLSATLQTGKNDNVNFDLKKGKSSGAAIGGTP